MRRGRRAHPRDCLLRLRQRLTPQRVNIGMLSRDRDRGVRGAAEIDRNMRLLNRLYLRRRAREPVVLALVIDWLVPGPDAAKDCDLFVRPRVTPIVPQKIAVLALVAVVAARD